MNNLVLAHSYDFFRSECNRLSINYKDYKYISSSYQIRGIDNATLYLIGDWHINRDSKYIIDYCQEHNIKILYDLRKDV